MITTIIEVIVIVFIFWRHFSNTQKCGKVFKFQRITNKVNSKGSELIYTPDKN